MKIWPFDIAAERTGGYDISPAELRAALEPFAKIRRAVGGGEVQRCRIEAVPQSGRTWAVVENVSQVATTTAA